MCCKCCQYCLETIWWHLIEKRFCYDESIALYEDPEKYEKNNNTFDNMAFYDSVAVIAGRSIVTIDRLPDDKPIIVQQPTRRVQLCEETISGLKNGYLSKSVPSLFETAKPEEDVSTSDSAISFKAEPDKTALNPPENARTNENNNNNNNNQVIDHTFDNQKLRTNGEEIDKTDHKNQSTSDQPSGDQEDLRHKSLAERRQSKSLHLKINTDDNASLNGNGDKEGENSNKENKSSLKKTSEDHVEPRKKSLAERRHSKNLYLEITQHKEIPIIRQSSMPKFYLDTPQLNQSESSLYRSPSTALTFPVSPNTPDVVFDLYSIVQIEKEKVKEENETSIQRDDKSSKLFSLKDKIKLRRVKSSLAGLTLPHTHIHPHKILSKITGSSSGGKAGASVTASRSMITTDRMSAEDQPIVKQHRPIDQQSTKRAQLREEKMGGLKSGYFSKSVPSMFEMAIDEEDVSKSDIAINFKSNSNKMDIKRPEATSTRENNTPGENKTYDNERLDANKEKDGGKEDRSTPDQSSEAYVELRKKSLAERRQSKSLYLEITQHKEIPIIRQMSMPKFYLDTPQPNQAETSLYRSPSTALTNPVSPNTRGFVFDLYSIVQMEKNKAKEDSGTSIQREDKPSKLFHLKDKIKLRRVKSSLAGLTLPHTHHI